MGFLSASDWFKPLIIFMSYLRIRVIPNNSLTNEDVRLKAFAGIEAKLRHEEYQGFEEGNLRFCKMNGEYETFFILDFFPEFWFYAFSQRVLEL